MGALPQELAEVAAGPLMQLRGALAEVGRLGGVEGLAGEPARLLQAADAWGERASALRELEGELDRQVRGSLAGRWQGEASDAFSANWQSLRGKLGELADACQGVAASLERSAGRVETLNSLAADLVAEMQAVAGALQGVQGIPDVAGLAARAGDLTNRLSDLLRQVDAAWLEFTSAVLAMSLRLQHELRTLPAVKPEEVARPAWEISARLGPGGTVVELRPSGQIDAGVDGAAVRRGPPPDAGSLGRWLLLLLAVLAGQDAGLLARLLASATGEGDPNRVNAENPANGEPAFGGPPQLGPPTEPPRDEKGEIDWEVWEARLRQKGVSGDLARRVADARKGNPGALEELTSAERLANAGYRVEFTEPVENAGRTNPDLTVESQHAGPGEPSHPPLRVEVKSGKLSLKTMQGAIQEANDQIKWSDGRADLTVVQEQHGYILYDASRTQTLKLDQSNVEQLLRGTMTPERFRQIEFLEVLYRDQGVWKRTFVYRCADGSVIGPITEQLSAP